MKVSVTDVAVLFLPLTLRFAGIDGKSKSSKTFDASFPGHTKPRFISFDSEEGKIDIDWDVTIPFISIPLNHGHEENGEAAPLLHVNTKALGVAGLVTTILTFIVPLFTTPTPELNYRSNDATQWSQMRSTLNEVILGNNYVAPCMQRVVCSLVSAAARAENPTSAEKIIDGLSSHKWFRDATNGTIIQDAVTMGREGSRDCGKVYKDCLITPRLLKSMISQFGTM